MRSPSVQELLLGAVQAASSLAIYILMRDGLEYVATAATDLRWPWLPQIDTVNTAALAAVPLGAAFLAGILQNGKRRLRIAGVAIVIAALSSLAIWQAAIHGWTSRLPHGVPTVSFWSGLATAYIITLWILIMAVAAVAAVAGAGLALVAESMSVRARTIAAALVGLLAAATAATAIHGRLQAGAGVIEFLARGADIKPFRLGLSVELVVDGRPLTITRTIDCRRAITIRESAEARNRGLPGDYRFPSLKSFGEVRPDGSGVFIVTPDLCQRAAASRATGGIQSGNIASPDDRPLIGFTPDASALAEFNLYTDATAFNTPASQVSFVSLRAVYAPDSGLDPPDEFAAIGWEHVWTTGTEYGAYFALSIRPDQWRSHPHTAAQLSHQAGFGFALADSSQHTPEGWAIYHALHADLENLHIERNGGSIANRPMVTAGGKLVPINGAIVPLRRAGDAWQLVPQASGVITFYKGLPTSLARVDLPELIELAGQSAHRPAGHPGEYIFDPASQMLYAIGHHHFQLAEPGSVFATR